MRSPYDSPGYREGGDPNGERRTMNVYLDLWDVRGALEDEVRTLLRSRRFRRRHIVMYQRLSALVAEFDRLASPSQAALHEDR